MVRLKVSVTTFTIFMVDFNRGVDMKRLILVLFIISRVFSTGLSISNSNTAISIDKDGRLVSTSQINEYSNMNNSIADGLIIKKGDEVLLSTNENALSLKGEVINNSNSYNDLQLCFRYSDTKLLLSKVGDLHTLKDHYSLGNSSFLNFRKEIVFFDPEGSSTQTAVNFTNGFGKVLQTQSSVNSSKWLVKAKTFDSFLRENKVLLPTPQYSAGNYIDFEKGQLLSSAQSYYGDMKPFTELEFSNNEDKVVKNGMIGENHEISKGVYTRSWAFYTSGDNSHSYFDENGFLKQNYFTQLENDENFSSTLRQAVGNNNKYSLTINRDINGDYEQIIADLKNQKLRTIIHSLEDPSKNRITKYKYDRKGNLLEVLPAEESINPTKYTYYKNGNLKSITTPDAGTTEYFYNYNGMLLKEVSGKGTNDEVTLEYHYNEVNFPFEVYLVNGNERKRIKRMYHDTKDILSDFADTPHIESIINSLTNLRGNLVGEAFWEENGEVVILDLLSYDSRNRTNLSYRYVSDFGWLKKDIEYTFTGNTSKETVTTKYLSTNEYKNILSFKYDALDRFSFLENGEGDKLVSYTYDDIDRIVEKKYYSKGATSEFVSVKYDYNSLSGLISIRAYKNGSIEPFFKEEIDYGNSHDGKIEGVTYFAAGKEEKNTYDYNRFNELTKRTVEKEGSSTVEEFSYDRTGRLKHQFSETSNVSYNYNPGNSYLTDFYTYNQRGNVVKDLEKDIDIKYDWRNLPTTFSTNKSAGEVKMSYDGRGGRIKKSTTSLYENSSKYYLMNTVFRSEYNSSDHILDYYYINTLNGVEGIIDIDENGNETPFYYLKDHLGSVREVVSGAGDEVFAATYSSYGQLDTLIQSTNDIVDHNFTGKELDDEGADEDGNGGLNYYFFGSRYYDPYKIQWLSPDPERQFASAFAYGGNPLIGIDPNGEYFGSFMAMMGIAAGAGGLNMLFNKDDIKENGNGFYYFALGFAQSLIQNKTGGGLNGSGLLKQSVSLTANTTWNLMFRSTGMQDALQRSEKGSKAANVLNVVMPTLIESFMYAEMSPKMDRMVEEISDKKAAEIIDGAEPTYRDSFTKQKLSARDIKKGKKEVTSNTKGLSNMVFGEEANPNPDNVKGHLGYYLMEHDGKPLVFHITEGDMGQIVPGDAGTVHVAVWVHPDIRPSSVRGMLFGNNYYGAWGIVGLCHQQTTHNVNKILGHNYLPFQILSNGYAPSRANPNTNLSIYLSSATWGTGNTFNGYLNLVMNGLIGVQDRHAKKISFW